MKTPLRFLSCLVFAGLLSGCGQQGAVGPQNAPEPDTYVVDQVAPTAVPSSITFTDIAAQAGIDFVHEAGFSDQKYMPETMGAGGGFFDYDNDGDLDIVLINSRHIVVSDDAGQPRGAALYRNDGNATFIDVTEDSGLGGTRYGMGCAMADVDGDGDSDILITAAIDGQRFYRNNGDGTFTDHTEAAGLTARTWIDDEGNPHNFWSTSAAFFDADRDGWLDLIVCNYIQWSVANDIYTTIDGVGKALTIPTLYSGLTPVFYRNQGDGTFADETEAAGFLAPDGKSLGVTIDDFNADGWLDVVIANDTSPNFLFMNQGDGVFLESALLAGIAYDENGKTRAGMGIDTAPLFEGQNAITIGNFSHEPISLYTWQANTFFVDYAGRARLSRPSLLSLTFGLHYLDYDLDGALDLAIANGHIEPDIEKVETNVTFAQSSQLFRNMDNQSFVEVTHKVGEDFFSPMVGRGLAYGDVDGDGDLDMLITNCNGAPRLLRNDNAAEASNWVRFTLEGQAPNTDAIGAKVNLVRGDEVVSRWVRTGSSYLSQSELTVTFGLGNTAEYDQLLIIWPDGTESVHDGNEFPANQHHQISLQR